MRAHAKHRAKDMRHMDGAQGGRGHMQTCRQDMNGRQPDTKPGQFAGAGMCAPHWMETVSLTAHRSACHVEHVAAISASNSLGAC